ncbi:MAG TPA: phytanoyl-CoA dioxygenase family protein [Mycobacteriales bacterium]|nr:phytanoyl-CoA dioxygenase family protein [Mycobacteriales bacterium]
MSPDSSSTTYVDAVRRDGFAIIEDAFDADLADAIRNDLDRLERDLGVVPAGNDFEGARTLRIYNLLVHGELYQQIPLHETVLPVVEGVLDAGCLISSLSSIVICPEETAQPIHADDILIPLEKPHAPIVCNTMWAITDFTDANGATRLVPGSHLRENPKYGGDYDTVPAEMRKGSVLVWDGALWHGGGANRTDERRYGIAMNYCAGFIRQQENQQLGVPADLARKFPTRLQQLLGYDVYNGLIGHIDKQRPLDLLMSDGTLSPMVWDL